jgi:hypothetical protein
VRKRLAPRPEVCQPVEVQAPAGLHALRRTRRTRPLNLRDRTHKLGLRRRLATPRTGMRSPITTALLPFRDRSHAGRFGLQPGLGLAVGRRRRLVGRDLDQLGGLCAQGRRDRTRNARTHTAPIPSSTRSSHVYARRSRQLAERGHGDMVRGAHYRSTDIGRLDFSRVFQDSPDSSLFAPGGPRVRGLRMARLARPEHEERQLRISP